MPNVIMPNQSDRSLHRSLAKYGPKLNTIYLKLHDYKYFHTSSNLEEKDRRIIGRHALKSQLFSLFTNGQTKNGTYLITGSRGMGKTSLVNDVLKRWRNKKDFKWKLVLTNLVFSILAYVWFRILFETVDSEQFWIFITSLILLLASGGSLIVIGIVSLFKKSSGKDPLALRHLFFREYGSSRKTSTVVIAVSVGNLFIIDRFCPFDFYASCILYAVAYVALIGVYYLCFRFDSSVEQLKPDSNSLFIKDILIINLDIGQEDIDETRILKQMVSRLGEMCSKVKREVHFIRKISTLTFSILLASIIVAMLYEVDRIHAMSQSPTWLEYFPSQVNTNYSLDDSNSLELSRLHIKSSDTLFEEHTIKQPEPTESVGWILHNVNKMIKSATQIVDYGINKTSMELYPLFFRSSVAAPSVKFSKVISPHYDSQITPPPYYLMIFIFFGILFLFNFLINWLLNTFYPPYYIQGEARIKRLTDRIYAETSEVAMAGLSQNRFFNWNRRRTITLPFAGKYEIQMEVQKIVSELSTGFSWVPFVKVDRQIVFVLDELDKIEPDRYYQETSPNSESEPAKTRQQRITRMLQSLKSFFNHSKAKFIFIAGDDMYDASIADASNNREHSIDRLFNKVFYIPSFYSDDSDHRKSNTNSMTESYVSQFLISPKQYDFLEPDKNQKVSDIEKDKIKLLNSTLEKYYSLFFPTSTTDTRNISNAIYVQKCELDDSSLENLARVKVLYTLKNFITYLAYQSNGSPKKITSLFEQYVVKGGDFPDDTYSMVVTDDGIQGTNTTGLDKNCFYLRLTEGDQYVFGLINYLVSPFLISQKRYLGSFGDKLLVSTSFIVDHLYKYHENAFSWKTLELTPEIISVNKAPQLRGFIKDIIYHFSRTHIDRITSGLFDFKFIGKVKNEIRYLSKVSDLEAAAFNFTLDESKQSKDHYQDKLRELRSVYENRLSGDKNDDLKFIHSLSFTNMILGDLEYYDQEYDNAVLYYLDAIQELRYLLDEKSKNYIYNAILYVRNSLKLGLAFEKQNNYDSALMTYDRLKQEILNLRDVDTSKFGYKEMVITYDNVPKFISDQITKVGLTSLYAAFEQSNHRLTDLDMELKEKSFNQCFDALEIPKDSQEAIEKTVNDWTERIWCKYPKQYEQIKVVTLLFYNLFRNRNRIFVVVDEEDEKFFSFGGNHFFRTYINQQAASKKHILTNGKLFTFENLRLLYQPFIATLSILEKDGINSITNKSIESTLKDFDFICRMINTHVPYMIEVEFLNKIGDILYFKNGMLKDWSNNPRLNKLILASREDIYLSNRVTRDYNLPAHGMLFYLLSIDVFWKGVKQTDKGSDKRYFHGSQGDFGTYNELFQKVKSEIGNYRFIGRQILESYEYAIEYINTGIGSPKYTNSRSIKLNTLANCYSDLGNSILSSISQGERMWSQRSVLGDLDCLLDLVKKLNKVLFARHSSDPDETPASVLDYLGVNVFSIQGAVTAYLISAALYHKTYKNLKSAFQLQKIITLIDDCIFISQGLSPKEEHSITIEQTEELLFKIDKELLTPFITKVNKAYQDAPWQDMANYKNAGGLVKDKNATKRVLRTQSLVEEHLVQDFKSRRNEKNSFAEIREKVRLTNKSNQPNIDFEFYKNSSIASEQKEVYVLMEKIAFRLNASLREAKFYNYESFCKKQLKTHPFIDNSNQMNRIHELFIRGAKLKQYYHLIKKDHKGFPKLGFNIRILYANFKLRNIIDRHKKTLFTSSIKLSRPKDQDTLKVFCDAIYSYNEIISKLNVIEASFQVPNIYFGFAHYELAFWLERLEELPEVHFKVFENLHEITSERENDFLNKQYQWAKAKYHFVTAMQTHRGMDPYNHTINSMYYLDDDFNDDQEHFYAAQERFHINNGYIQYLCEELRNKLDNADKLFNYDFYSTNFVPNAEASWSHY